MRIFFHVIQLHEYLPAGRICSFSSLDFKWWKSLVLALKYISMGIETLKTFTFSKGIDISSDKGWPRSSSSCLSSTARLCGCCALFLRNSFFLWDSPWHSSRGGRYEIFWIDTIWYDMAYFLPVSIWFRYDNINHAY